ncbi:MAG: hypothetical protein GXO61_04235 [Epsilonproteobacteria bacterium]|nr:hypothetical protein [Campylobacterota bacterium]
MRKTLTLFALLFLLLGCNSKETLSVFEPDKPYMEAMRWTAKGDISVSLENKALIIATYLNPIERKTGNERFFIRVYIDNDFDDPKKAGLFHPGYKLLLNGIEPLKIEELEYENPLVKKMPFVEKWYRFYIVEFPKQEEEEELRLTFENEEYPPAELIFRKFELEETQKGEGTP